MTAMKTVREALIWHLDRFGTDLAEVSRGSGVSHNALKQLSARVGASTSAEKAQAIAAHFGKTLEQFRLCEPTDDEAAITALALQLSPEDRRIVVAQIRALIAARGQ